MIKKLGLILLGIILALLLLEAGMRIAGLVYLALQEHGNTRALKNKGTYKIMCLGESTTQGQYPGFLEEELNNRNLGIMFSIIDKGRVACNTNFILLNLESDLKQYSPDMVISMMGVNDNRGAIVFEDASDNKEYKTLKIYKLAMLLKLHIVNKSAGTRKLVPGKEDKKDIGLENAVKYEKDKYYLDLASRYEKNGLFKKAEEMYKKAVEISPLNAAVYSRLGDIYFTVEDNKKAEEMYIKALSLDDNLEQPYYRLFSVYLQTGQTKEAEDILNRSFKIQNKSGEYVRLFLKHLNKSDFNDQAVINNSTIYNYIKLREMLKERGIKYACMQYPMRKVEDLKGIFKSDKDIVYIDNEKVFKDAVSKDGYDALFKDRFVSGFGHCTDKGNRLIAKNIADVLSKEVFISGNTAY